MSLNASANVFNSTRRGQSGLPFHHTQYNNFYTSDADTGEEVLKNRKSMPGQAVSLNQTAGINASNSAFLSESARVGRQRSGDERGGTNSNLRKQLTINN